MVKTDDAPFGLRGTERKMVMIILTRCNGTTIMLNENFIEMAEETPDTVVTMQNGHRYIIQEKLEDIIAMAAAYRRQNVTDKEN